MCTCGIAMATQQATPATHSSACSVFGETPSEPGAAVAAAPACERHATRRAAGAAAAISGSIVTTQKMPIADMRRAPAVGRR